MGRDVMEAEAAVVGMRPAEGTRAAVGLGTEVPGARLLLIDDYEFIRIGVRTMCARLHGRPVEWHEAGSLQDGIDPDTADGQLMLNLLVRLAHYDRQLIGERIAAGMDSARQAGAKIGRPPVDPQVTADKLRTVQESRARGLTAAEAAQLVGWSRATFYRHLHERESLR